MRASTLFPNDAPNTFFHPSVCISTLCNGRPAFGGSLLHLTGLDQERAACSVIQPFKPHVRATDEASSVSDFFASETNDRRPVRKRAPSRVSPWRREEARDQDGRRTFASRVIEEHGEKVESGQSTKTEEQLQSLLRLLESAKARPSEAKSVHDTKGRGTCDEDKTLIISSSVSGSRCSPKTLPRPAASRH